MVRRGHQHGRRARAIQLLDDEAVLVDGDRRCGHAPVTQLVTSSCRAGLLDRDGADRVVGQEARQQREALGEAVDDEDVVSRRHQAAHAPKVVG